MFYIYKKLLSFSQSEKMIRNFNYTIGVYLRVIKVQGNENH